MPEKNKCEGCGGACCRFIFMPYASYLREIMRLRGCKVGVLEKKIIFAIPSKCEYLDDKTGKCNCYGSRPSYCRAFACDSELCKTARSVYKSK